MTCGVQYQLVRDSKGKKVARHGDTVGVRYKGMLLNGRQFDTNMPRGRPLYFTVGEGQVIRGMEEGIKGMSVGSRRNIMIPSNLGYGEKGSPPEIPKNADLVFEIELVGLDGVNSKNSAKRKHSNKSKKKHQQI